MHALDGVDLRVEHGDYVAIMGASGSGKSTLMNIIGCLDVGTAGRYLLDGIDVRRLDERQLSLVRNRKIGFVFQSFNLIARTTAQRNVELPLAYAGVKSAERAPRASAALDRVGLVDREPPTCRPSCPAVSSSASRWPARSSPSPCCCSPTSPPEPSTATAPPTSWRLFDELAAGGRTVVVITHEDEVAHHAKRIIRMSDGRIVSDVRQVGVARAATRWLGRDGHRQAEVQVDERPGDACASPGRA